MRKSVYSIMADNINELKSIKTQATLNHKTAHALVVIYSDERYMLAVVDFNNKVLKLMDFLVDTLSR